MLSLSGYGPQMENVGSGHNSLYRKHQGISLAVFGKGAWDIHDGRPLFWPLPSALIKLANKLTGMASELD